MTTRPHLEGLIRKWREESIRRHDTALDAEEIDDQAWNNVIGNALHKCARELEQALAALPGGGVDAGAMDRSAPERVWLQIDVDGDEADRSEPIPRDAWDQLTWHHSRIGGQEIEYIRADLALPTPNPHEADRNG